MASAKPRIAHGACSRPMVTGLVVLALSLLCLWLVVASRIHDDEFSEAFVPKEGGVFDRSLGALASTLIGSSDGAVARSVSVSDTIAYTPFETTIRLDVVESSHGTVRVSDADALIARGAYVSKHVQLVPSDNDVSEIETPNNVRVYEVARGSNDTQVMHVVHTAKLGQLDVSLWSKVGSPAMTFRGVRVAFDASALVDGMDQTPQFRTPETLKRKVLAGVTMVVPRESERAVVTFRRFRESNGYIVFGVVVHEEAVIIRHVEFADSVPPNNVDNAIRALEWSETGEFATGAPFHAVPDSAGGISRTEAMSANEIRRAMVTAVSVTIPMRRHHQGVIVEVTPGIVRATGYPAGDRVESRVARVPPCMSGSRKRWEPDPSRPLQMEVRGCLALPVPCGDHVHLSRLVASRT